MGKILVFLAEGFEEVEGLTAVDMLRRAGLTTDMVSMQETKDVTGSHGITVKADCLYKEADFSNADMLLLPGGGPGTEQLLRHAGLAERLKEFDRQGKMLAAICAGPSVLGAAGVLKGKKATCYPGFEDRLEGAEWIPEPVICDKNVITGRGLGAAIAFSSAIIAHFKGKEKALEVERAIMYKETKA